MLAVAPGLPARYGAVRADALDVGHERADAALLVFLVLLPGHRRVLSDPPGRPRRPGSSLWRGAGGLAGVIARLIVVAAALDGPQTMPR